MLALAMAALFSFAVAGTAFANHGGSLELEQTATAVAVGGDGGDGGDATNNAEVDQSNAFVQANVAQINQDQSADAKDQDQSADAKKGKENKETRVAVAELTQVNAAQDVTQVNAAVIDQEATGGAGGAGGDAFAAAANLVAVDVDLLGEE